MNHLVTLADLLAERPTKRRAISIPEFSETLTISAGKYRGAKFLLNRAPYMIEPLRLMSPDSNYQNIVLQWPAQVGKSTVGEIAIMYYISECPSEILYVSANESSAEKFMKRRIEPMAAAQGIIFSNQTDSKTSRASGDTQYAKEFPGGNLDAVSALSASQLASSTKRCIIADEVSRWKRELSEGDTWEIMSARSQQWGSDRKQLAISTPVLHGDLIHTLYNEGDQRQYYVPCPFCGEMQLLDFFSGRGHGLHWENISGKIDKKSIGIICQKCGKKIPEQHKHTMLNGGEWRASVSPLKEYTASFHINGLYSPFISWSEMAQAFADAEGNPQKRQSFINLKMGLPFKETGTKPDVEKLISNNRGFYKSGEVPPQVLYTVAGADVQRGSANDPLNPPRIELSVVGIGSGHRTYLIDHLIFSGAIDDPFSGAWAKMHDHALETNLGYKRTADGRIFYPSMIFIDSGDGVFFDAVYRFTQLWANTFPSKGFTALKKQRHEAPDEVTTNNFKRYRAAKMPGDVVLYEISTNYYKNFIYSNLNIERIPGSEQKYGFIELPIDTSENYMQQLVSEERLSDGSFKAKGRNEALDCMVYSLAAADAYLDAELDLWRQDARARGCNAFQIQQITRRTVIDAIAASVKLQIPPP